MSACTAPPRWRADDEPTPSDIARLFTARGTSGVFREINANEIPRVPMPVQLRPCCAFGKGLHVKLDPERLISGDFEAVEMRGQKIEQEITADTLDERRANVLEAETGGPALVISRRHYEGRRMTSAGVHIHPADRYSIRSVVASSSREAAD